MEIKSKNRAPMLTCRYCKGAHFTYQCPNKNEMEKMQALQDRIKAKTEVVEETVSICLLLSYYLFLFVPNIIFVL